MGKTMLISIPDRVWSDFQRAASHCDVDAEDVAAFSMVYALCEYSQSWQAQHPYKTQPVQGGWNIFYCEDGKEPRLSDVHPEPFPENRKPNADRLRKAVNKRWWKQVREADASDEDEFDQGRADEDAERSND